MAILLNLSLIKVKLKEKHGCLNASHSDYERNQEIHNSDTEFYYHTDVKIDFSQNRWYWNSTKKSVMETSWDNRDYLLADFPFMQDVIALNIYSDKILYYNFVSLNPIADRLSVNSGKKSKTRDIRRFFRHKKI